MVTHLTPVSLVAQTGLYSLVHISGLGLLHWVIDSDGFTGLSALTGCAVEHDQAKTVKLNMNSSFMIFCITGDL